MEEDEEKLQKEINLNRMLSPAGINVRLPRFKHERLKRFKDAMVMGWEEFIGDYFYEILNAIFFGVAGQGAKIRYENKAEALVKVLNKYNANTTKRMKKKGWMP